MRRYEFTDEQILQCYKDSASVPEAAKKLGVNRKTLWRWLKKLGVHVTRTTYQASLTRDWGSFARWLGAYKKPLPNSVKELVELSGCSRASVQSYLYRRKKAFEQKARKYLTTYLQTHTEWPDGTPITVPEYTVKGDLWTHTVTVCPSKAESFIIGVKPPSGYRRKN